MTEYDLNQYLNDKYTEQQLASIKEYRTFEWRDRNNQLIVPAGQIVDENFKVEYLRKPDCLSFTNSVSFGV